MKERKHDYFVYWLHGSSLLLSNETKAPFTLLLHGIALLCHHIILYKVQRGKEGTELSRL